MDKSVYFKELEKLQTYEFRKFGSSQFKKYLLTEKEWIKWKQRTRILNECFVIVWSTWKKKLLARTFAIREEYINGERFTSIDEVQRQIAGNPYKLVRNVIYRMYWGWGYRYQGEEWKISNIKNNDIIDGDVRCGVYHYNDYEKFFKKSIHKYCGFDFLGKNRKTYSNLFQIFIDYEKEPRIEFLLKAGLSNLYFDKSEYRLINLKKKGINIFGLKYKESIKYLKKGNNLSFMKKYEDIIVKNKLNDEEVSMIKAFKRYDIEANVKMIKYCTKKNITAIDYKDYLSFVDTLGIPNTSKILFPDDFWEEHDKLESQISPEKYDYNDEIKKVAQMLREYIYTDENFIIRPIADQFELNKESHELKHCVRSYGKDIASHKTSIFVIRKKDNSDMPYYTLELRKGTIEQVRGEGNKNPTSEVNSFVTDWSERYRFEYEC